MIFWPSPRLGLLCLALWPLTVQLAWGQSATNSIYSGYGVGDLANAAYGRGWGMGGLGVATTDRANLSQINPATWADLAITTVDVSGIIALARFASPVDKVYNRAGGVQGVAFGFPSNKGFTLGFGLAPYSNVNYQIYTTPAFQDPNNSTITSSIASVQGNGSINKFYLGGARTYLHRRLAVGLNAGFLFGYIRQQYQTILSDGTKPGGFERDNSVRGLQLSLGATYTDTLGAARKWLGRAGAAVDVQSRMGVVARRVTITYDPSGATYTDTLGYGSAGGFVIPPLYKFGLGAELPGKYNFSLEANYQAWAPLTLGGQAPGEGPRNPDTLKPLVRLIAGGEWIPNYSGNLYVKRIAYRAGVRYEHGYIDLRGRQLSGYLLTVGLGLPLKRSFSRINLGAGYGMRGTLQNGLIQESYYQFVIGITFTERWFIKRKYD